MIVEISALPNGAHRNQMFTPKQIPDGWIEIPTEMVAQAKEFLPFINLTIKTGTITAVAQGGKPPEDIESTRAAKLSELSAASQAAIVAGCDVTLSDGATGHISLTDHDQMDLSVAQAAVKAGATDYPYHLDGQLCAVYPAADILAMSTAAVSHILYHTTYCNHLLTWARRAATAEELSGITYGAALPEDLKTNMDAVLAAAGGTANG